MAGEQVIQYMELLTGGSSTAVDGIDGDDRGDGEAITLDDICYANVSGVHYVYKYTATAAVESVPDIIRPDVNNDPTKAWVLQEINTPKVTLTDGQIAFPATAVSSSDPNTLDDYEEGAFSPTFTGSGGSFASYGRYTKIGNRCFIDIDLSAIESTAGGSVVTIGNLPFTSSTNTNYRSAMSIGYIRQVDYPDDTLQLVARIINNSDIIYLSFSKDDNSEVSATGTNFDSPGCQIIVSGSYEVS